MNNIEKLIRYCFLGSINPVFNSGQTDFKLRSVLPSLRRLCKSVSDKQFHEMVLKLISSCKVPRMNELLLICVVYLHTDLDEPKWRIKIRDELKNYILDDNDIFLVCHYTLLIQQIDGRSYHINRTMKEALAKFYISKTREEIVQMFIQTRNGYNLNHKKILKMIHLADYRIPEENKFIIKMFFRDISEYISDKNEPDLTEIASVKWDNMSIPEYIRYYIAPLHRLRMERNFERIIQTIDVYNLNIDQLPENLWKNEDFVLHIIPKMHLTSLLKKLGLIFANYQGNSEIYLACRKVLNDPTKFRHVSIHPVDILIYKYKLQIFENEAEQLFQRNKTANTIKFPYLDYLHSRSFGLNEAINKRIMITINIRSSSRNRSLSGICPRIKYIEAAVNIGFSFYVREEDVNVYYFDMENSPSAKFGLSRLMWHNRMDINDAMVLVNRTTVFSCRQHLVSPIIHAAAANKVFDLFITIVLTAAFGNPNEKSDLLYNSMEDYRKSLNPNAKYIILSLCRNTPSMRYSQERKEGIIELCGLRNNTIPLIQEFSKGNFI